MSKDSILYQNIKAVNIGAKLFAEALTDQDIEIVQLDWMPPRTVVLKPRIAEILSKME